MEGSINLEDDIAGTLLKSVIFGALVGMIATYRGYTSEPTSAGVSAATTGTVVTGLGGNPLVRLRPSPRSGASSPTLDFGDSMQPSPVRDLIVGLFVALGLAHHRLSIDPGRRV
jgi:hypothetical protein